MQTMYTKSPIVISKVFTHSSFWFLFIIPIILASCASTKDINYFQPMEGQQIDENFKNFEPKIQFGDILIINVSSLEPEAAIPFNTFETQSNGISRPLPYIVNAEGNIHFPSIGKFKVAGFTINEITEDLYNKLLPFLNNPIINIRLDNFKVSVLGEVRTPGSYTVSTERINIIEAIALAGDLTIYGKRKSISLIREQDGKRTINQIDLTNRELFNSPNFYLAQNDIIYVESNKTKVNSSKVGPNTAIILSSISILISLAALIIK